MSKLSPATRHGSRGTRWIQRVTLAVTMSLSIMTAGYQALGSAVVISDSLSFRIPVATLIGLTPTVAVWIASSRGLGSKSRLRVILFAGAVAALAADFMLTSRFLAAAGKPYPWVGSSFFTFLHLCGPLALLLFLAMSSGPTLLSPRSSGAADRLRRPSE